MSSPSRSPPTAFWTTIRRRVFMVEASDGITFTVNRKRPEGDSDEREEGGWLGFFPIRCVRGFLKSGCRLSRRSSSTEAPLFRRS